MKIRTALLVCVVLLTGRTALAQEYDKWEIPVDYSYANGHPANVLHHFSLNGGGGGIVFNINRFWGIKGDLQGYGSSTSTFTNVTVVNPLITGGTEVIPSISASGNLFTYMAGPQFRLPTHTFKPFAEFLVGGAHTNLYRNLYSAVMVNPLDSGTTTVTSAASSNNSFAMIIGGGIDIRLSKHVALRPFEMDYVYTQFKDNLVPGGNHHQNNWRYLAGLNFTFGE